MDRSWTELQFPCIGCLAAIGTRLLPLHPERWVLGISKAACVLAELHKMLVGHHSATLSELQVLRAEGYAGLIHSVLLADV